MYWIDFKVINNCFNKLSPELKIKTSKHNKNKNSNIGPNELKTHSQTHNTQAQTVLIFDGQKRLCRPLDLDNPKPDEPFVNSEVSLTRQDSKLSDKGHGGWERRPRSADCPP